MAGVYAYLPLGLRVLSKIENIIREELNSVGGQEMLMTALQKKNSGKRQTDGMTRLWTIGSKQH